MKNILRVLFCVLACSTLSFAIGATAIVKKLDLGKNTATIEVTNTSDKDITAFSVIVDAIRASGAKDHSERTKDYGPFITLRGEALHPGAISEEPELWEVTADPLVGVDVKVVAVVYTDQTADVIDQEAFKRIVDHRTQVARALAKSAEILKNALADTANEHPSTKAANDITQVLKQAKASLSRDLDDVYLQGVREELQNAPVRSAQRKISERDLLAEQLAKLQQDAAVNEKYAQVRNTQ
jgi:hypothetical protein